MRWSFFFEYNKIRKRANIRNWHNQAPHLTQDTNGKVITSQLVITNESQEVSPFPAGDHNASINRQTRMKAQQKQDRNNINDPQKKHRLGTISQNILLEGLNRFHGAPTLPLVQMWIKTHRYFAWDTPNLSIHYLLEHINKDIRRSQSKDNDSTVNKLKPCLQTTWTITCIFG